MFVLIYEGWWNLCYYKVNVRENFRGIWFVNYEFWLIIELFVVSGKWEVYDIRMVNLFFVSYIKVIKECNDFLFLFISISI